MNENHVKKPNARSSHTKRRISDAYLALMLEKNWEKISVKEICELAGLSRGTFYQHFEDIYDVMDQLQTGLIAEFSEMLHNSSPVPVVNKPEVMDNFDNNFSTDIPPLFNTWYALCQEHKTELLSLCNPENGDLCFPQRMKTLVLPHLDAMMDRDGMPRDGFREHYHMHFFNLMYYVMYIWLKGETGAEMTAGMMADVLNEMRIGAAYSYYKNRLPGELRGETAEG